LGAFDQVTVAARVGVVTRTKSRPLLLGRAIRSVRQQTFEDFVHVIVNDGGDPAEVRAVVERFGGGRRTVIVDNPVSVGMEAASNIGIEGCDTEFLVVHDDDDTWHPRFLERTVRVLDQYPFGGVATSVIVVTETVDRGHIALTDLFRFGVGADEMEVDVDSVTPPPEEPASPPRPRGLFDGGDVSLMVLYRMLRENLMPPISFLFRRSAYEEVGSFSETLPVLGDWDFHIRFLRRFDIGRLDEELAYYHHRHSSVGIYGNTVISGRRDHEFYRTWLQNQTLRQELANGSASEVFGGYAGNVEQFGSASVEGQAALRARLAALSEQQARTNAQQARTSDELESLRAAVEGTSVTVRRLEEAVGSLMAPGSLEARISNYLRSLPRTTVRKVETRAQRAIGRTER
jgi:glycosyltransferase involved in cell wall biosynthesis